MINGLRGKNEKGYDPASVQSTSFYILISRSAASALSSKKSEAVTQLQRPH